MSRYLSQCGLSLYVPVSFLVSPIVRPLHCSDSVLHTEKRDVYSNLQWFPIILLKTALMEIQFAVNKVKELFNGMFSEEVKMSNSAASKMC